MHAWLAPPDRRRRLGLDRTAAPNPKQVRYSSKSGPPAELSDLLIVRQVPESNRPCPSCRVLIRRHEARRGRSVKHCRPGQNVACSPATGGFGTHRSRRLPCAYSLPGSRWRRRSFHRIHATSHHALIDRGNCGPGDTVLGQADAERRWHRRPSAQGAVARRSPQAGDDKCACVPSPGRRCDHQLHPRNLRDAIKGRHRRQQWAWSTTRLAVVR